MLVVGGEETTKALTDSESAKLKAVLQKLKTMRNLMIKKLNFLCKILSCEWFNVPH